MTAKAAPKGLEDRDRGRAEEDAMHPMFAELFMNPEEPEADYRRGRRRARRTRQLRTVSAARGKPGNSRRAALIGQRAP